ncbi:ABC transporter substrate-binding protein [Chondromyces crocatus]|uniref:Periplasmic substrate-binding protein n=1 Tax=Chondromyces crocatus TaxID=52 RepID=A0A0K1E6S7_CHOCO|nr:helical backbone metal receptor [Chondromyces crocatus]AKT36283.1 periplasmic substrate-binding protein [Chondromyces crocatus]
MIQSRRSTLLALASFALAACGKRKEEAATTPGGAPRVVSLSPSTTEAVFSLGAGPALVGRSRYCDSPAEAKRLPAVGGYADPNVEAILALQPTLVVGARGPAGPALEETLRAHGVATFFPETESIAQIEQMLLDLGQRLGVEPAATRTVARMHTRCEAVEAAAQGRPRVRVALLFDAGPLVAAGPGGFPDELLRRVGGENVITRGGPYPTLSIEALLALDPEVLLDATEVHEGAPGPSRLLALRDTPGFRELRAMREGHIRVLDSATALRPGPRICDGLAAVARAVHGDALALPALPEEAP